MVRLTEGEEGFSLVEVSMVLSVLAVLGVVVVAPGINKLIKDSDKISEFFKGNQSVEETQPVEEVKLVEKKEDKSQ